MGTHTKHSRRGLLERGVVAVAPRGLPGAFLSGVVGQPATTAVGRTSWGPGGTDAKGACTKQESVRSRRGHPRAQQAQQAQPELCCAPIREDVSLRDARHQATGLRAGAAGAPSARGWRAGSSTSRVRDCLLPRAGDVLGDCVNAICGGMPLMVSRGLCVRRWPHMLLAPDHACPFDFLKVWPLLFFM